MAVTPSRTQEGLTWMLPVSPASQLAVWVGVHRLVLALLLGESILTTPGYVSSKWTPFCSPTRPVMSPEYVTGVRLWALLGRRAFPQEGPVRCD